MTVILPTFEDEEKLTAGKLNQLRDAIESKFSAITGADLTWPLVAGGSIDMNGYPLTGLQTFWNVINADEYDTLQDAITAAVAGGCVLIPPHTTITEDNIDIAGSDILIMGCGASSVLKITGSATGFLLRTTASKSNIGICNLTLDGNGGGAGVVGVKVQRADGFYMDRVWMDAFTGAFIELTNDSTPGNSCTNTQLSNLYMTNGTTSHIIGNDIDGLQMTDVISKVAGSNAIDLTAGAGTMLRDIQLQNVRVTTVTGVGIRIIGDGTATNNQSRIQANNCQVSGSTGDAFRFGETAKMLKWVDISNCTAHTSGAKGFVVNSTGGVIKSCHAYSASTTGLDIVASDSLIVRDCDLPDFTLYGIDAGTSTDCFIVNTNVSGSGTEGIFRDNVTSGLRCEGIIGEVTPTIGTVHAEHVDIVKTDTSWVDTGWTYTIPANTLKDGDCVRVTIAAEHNSSNASEFRLFIGASNCALFNIPGADAWATAIYTIHVEDLDGTSKTYYSLLSVNDTSGVDAFSDDAKNIDWTADVTLKIQSQVPLGGGGEARLHEIMIEFLGGI